MISAGGFKDRKAGLVIVILAFIGVAAAGLSAYLHYYPGMYQSFSFCGGDDTGNCKGLDQWEYATVFGIPLACYGFLMYFFVLVTALATWYAGGSYFIVGLMLIFPVTVVSLLVDGVLGATMIRLKTFCMLCATTYLINIMLFLAAFLGLRRRKIHQGDSFREILKTFLFAKADSSDKRAAMVLYVLLIFFLSFSILSMSYLLQARFLESKKQTKQVVEAFLQQPVEDLVLPESRLTFGPHDAKVQIVVFTDFLCPSCFKFYKFKTDTYAKYGKKVFVAYYNYPLDQTCNPYFEHTSEKSSCLAAKAVLAAADLNVFPAYLERNYSRYKEISRYSQDIALEMAEGLIDQGQFSAEMNSEWVNQVLKRDIELAKKLDINTTPTIFINGRRINGVPSREILEAIIDKELEMPVFL